jgi:hypothetical protein
MRTPFEQFSLYKPQGDEKLLQRYTGPASSRAALVNALGSGKQLNGAASLNLQSSNSVEVTQIIVLVQFAVTWAMVGLIWLVGSGAV